MRDAAEPRFAQSDRCYAPAERSSRTRWRGPAVLLHGAAWADASPPVAQLGEVPMAEIEIADAPVGGRGSSRRGRACSRRADGCASRPKRVGPTGCRGQATTPLIDASIRCPSIHRRRRSSPWRRSLARIGRTTQGVTGYCLSVECCAMAPARVRDASCSQAAVPGAAPWVHRPASRAVRRSSR